MHPELSLLIKLRIDLIIFIHPVADIQKIPHLKIKIGQAPAQLLRHRTLQKMIQLRHQMHQMNRKTTHLFHALITALAFPLQRQQMPVAPFQRPDQPLILSPDQPLHLQKVFFYQAGAVHIPPPLHQIVRLIHQKKPGAFDALPEKTLQIYIGIKHIVVITDDHIHPRGEIQIQFKRADPVLMRLLKDYFSGKRIRPAGPQIIDRLIDPVKMSFGIWAVIRVARSLFADTQLLLRREDHRLQPHPLLSQDIQRIPCHRPGDRPGSQIKDLVADPLSHGFQRRKQGGQCLPHSRRCLDKQPLLPEDSPVHTHDQLSLSLPVCIWKGQRLQRYPPFLFPSALKGHPSLILLHKRPKPFTQLPDRIFFRKRSCFLRVQVGIDHADPDPFQMILLQPDPGVALCLCQMNRYGFLHLHDIAVGSLDLIHRHYILVRPDTVRTSLHTDTQPFHRHQMLQRYFCLITGSHALLELPVQSAPRLHCFCFFSPAPYRLSRSPLLSRNSTRFRTDIRITVCSMAAPSL